MHVEKAQSVYRFEGGRKILDAISSWWVTLDGHANPRIVADSRAGEETSMGRQSAGRGRFEEKLSARGELLPSFLNLWKQKIVAFAGGLGAPGLFLISFLDSSVLTFPVINDLLLIELSIRRPAKMPVYAVMAMLGSVAGCVLLFYIAQKGGEALFHKHAGNRAQAIHNWVLENGFGGMLIAALLPPPTPFKVFVVAAGVFEVPLASFTLAIALARAVRYFGIGYLAIRYGRDAMPYLVHHKLTVTVFLILFALVSYLLSRAILRHRGPGEK